METDQDSGVWSSVPCNENPNITDNTPMEDETVCENGRITVPQYKQLGQILTMAHVQKVSISGKIIHKCFKWCINGLFLVPRVAGGFW